MSGMKTLAGDTVIYGLSTILTRMLNYLMVPYLTRVMGTGEYGVVTDIYSLIPFALVILTLGLEKGYFRFAGKADGEDEKRKVFATAWGATLIAAAAFAAVAALMRGPMGEALGYGGRSEIVLLTIAIVALDIASSMPFARLREQRRSMRYVGVRLASVVVNLGMCLWFYSGLGLTGAEWVLAANAAASVVAAVILLPTVRGIVPRVDWAIFRTVMAYSLPLLISGVAGTGAEFIDRQMIKWLLPAGEAMSSLGIYGATTKLAVIMTLFTTMYQLAAEPFFLAKFGRGEFRRQSGLAMRMYLAVAAVIFVAIMVGKPLIVQILGERFRGGSHLLPVMLASNVLAGVVLNLSFWYKQMGRTWIAIAVTGTGLGMAVAANMMLVPRMGYEGAAWARLMSECAMVAVSWVLVERMKRRYEG